jgi:hypothetical protein
LLSTACHTTPTPVRGAIAGHARQQPLPSTSYMPLPCGVLQVNLQALADSDHQRRQRHYCTPSPTSSVYTMLLRAGSVRRPQQHLDDAVRQAHRAPAAPRAARRSHKAPRSPGRHGPLEGHPNLTPHRMHDAWCSSIVALGASRHATLTSLDHAKTCIATAWRSRLAASQLRAEQAAQQL